MGNIHVKSAVFALVGIMGLLFSGCSSDGDSFVPSNLSTRVNVLSAANGILAPVVESTEERVVSPLIKFGNIP
jgi:hypothetical protein